ncbi:DUF835 domain-containing protein [Thermococcus sp.]|uniref:DUF835 domain-containing protein n=1 Tax=Thermococcus sp. TaxID=35749 RepID=UPI002608279F|nr:DUF835 domain-containing protein [Thermococcus sp.]
MRHTQYLQFFHIATALAVIAVMLSLLLFSLRYREKFRDSYPGLARAYDWMIVAWTGFCIAKMAFLPVDLQEGGLKIGLLGDFSYPTLACNLILGLSLLALAYGWSHILRTIVVEYELVPVVEMNADNKSNLAPGLYLVTPKNALKVLKKFLPGRAAVIISRQHPSFFRKTLGLERTPAIWLSRVGEEDSIHPRKLEQLTHILVQFMRRGEPEKLIYIDGLEYLVLENGFVPVFKFLSHIKDYSLINNTVTIVVFEPNSLEKREAEFLRREFKILE